MNKRCIVGLLVMLASLLQVGTSATPRRVTPASMDANTRELFDQSMKLNAKLFDPSVNLIRSPEYRPGVRYPGNYIEDRHYFEKCCSRVRETSFYALGLLLRDGPGDRQQAADALDAVLKQQYVTPGVHWFGTYKRTPEEPDPGANAVMWQDYDPNWREFIGTTLEMILIEYSDRLPHELVERLYKSIDLAVAGEIAEGRLVPTYTNPSLMLGSLWDFAATHDNATHKEHPDWQKRSADWIDSVHGLFMKYGAFYEFNSPTYYGVDLYGLDLWRDYGSTEHIRTVGAEMEDALWEDIADFYQPDLHNISGPYDRSYGMDMESYVSLVAVPLAVEMSAKNAPLPPMQKIDGSGLSYVPEVAILGTRIPPDALMKMTKFSGEHLARRQIADQRVATAWIGKQVIYGGEATGKTKDVPTGSQFHPATIQWRTPSAEIGWVNVVQAPMIDATADEHGLTISATGTVRLRIHAKDLTQTKIAAAKWDLPGLQVAVTSDAKSFSTEKTDDGVDLVYAGMTAMRLSITAAR